MIASINPLMPKLASRRLNVVTMVTTPKSPGVKIRARMTVLNTWAPSASAEAETVAAAPRTARRRNSWPPFPGSKAPLASNGIIFYVFVICSKGHLQRGLHSVRRIIPSGTERFDKPDQDGLAISRFETFGGGRSGFGPCRKVQY